MSDTPADKSLASSPNTPSNNRRRKIAVVLAVAIVLALAGWAYYYFHARHWESTDDAYLESDIVIVSSRVSGHVIGLRVDDNQRVATGQLLAEIDPRDFENRLAQARAALEAARAREESSRIGVTLTQDTTTAALEGALSGVAAARAAEAAARSRQSQAEAEELAAAASVRQAEAQAMAADAEAVRAGADARRMQVLFDKDEISRQQLDHGLAAEKAALAQAAAAQAWIQAAAAQEQQAKAARTTAAESARQAAAMIREAEARLAAARTAPDQVASSRTQAVAAGAEMERLQAAVRQAELDLSFSRITAPVAGRVTKKAVETGNYVTTGQALLALVPAQVWVVANFKETQLTAMRPGQQAEVHVDTYPGRTFRGHVDSIQAGTGSRFSLLPPENATGNYVKVVQRIPVKIVLDEAPDPEHPLSPGMSVVPEVRVR